MEQKKFDCLSPKLSILGNHFLEASAGTGKTFAIEHIFVRLLLSSFSLSEILVITFTKASTRELKRRIHGVLCRAISFFERKRNDVGTAYLQEILEKGEGEQALFTLERALSQFDEAQIFTIHGFCYRSLREAAFEAGVDVDFPDPESSSYNDLVRLVIIDVLRKDDLLGCGASQISMLLKKHKGDINKIIKKIMHLVHEGGTFPDLPDYSESLHRLNQAIQKIADDFPDESAHLLEKFEKIAPSYRKLTDRKGDIYPHFIQQAELLTKCLREKSMEKGDFEALIYSGVLFINYIDAEYLKKRAKNADGQKFFEFLKEEISPHMEKAVNPAATILRIAKTCSAHLKKIKEEQGFFHPDDLLEKMHESIKTPLFAKKIGQKYGAVIIDEFQDTDRLQFEIIDHLFLREEKALAAYFVGDPKQSIYAFRNADLSTYFRAKELLGGEAVAFLDTNFRSQPKLVNALNTLFSETKVPGWLSQIYTSTEMTDASVHPEACEKYRLTYHPVDSKPGGEDIPFQDGKGSVHFCFAKEEKNRGKLWPSLKTEENFFFPYIAEEILSLKKRENASFRDMTVLIKDRFQAERLKRFLSKNGIPAIAKGVTSILETEAFTFFETLFSALSKPRNISLIKQFLSLRFLGFSHLDLRGHLENPLIENAAKQFSRLEKILREKGFACFWEHFLQTCFFNEETFYESLIFQGLDNFSDVIQVATLLMEFETSLSVTLEDYLSYLEELSQSSFEDKQSLIRKGISEKECVTLMTTFMSKGLEFDYVFALGLASRHTSQNEVIKVREKGKLELALFDLKNEKCKRALHHQDSEKMRLFYVALTRAKKRVYVPYVFDDEVREKTSPMELYFHHALGENMHDLESVKNFLLENASITWTDLTKYAFSIEPHEEKISIVNHIAPEAQLHFPPVYSYSFSSLSQGSSSAPREKKIETEKISLHSLPAGSETGQMVHGIFEQVIKVGAYFPFDRAAIKKITDKVLMGSFLENWKEVVYEMVVNVFHLPFSTSGQSFCLKDIPPPQMLTEVEFGFLLQEDAYIKGFVDLVFMVNDRYYLLDWKSNWLGNDDAAYSHKHLEETMKEKEYFLQGSLYASALKRYVESFSPIPFEKCFGGMYYFFVRGLENATNGIFFFRPEVEKMRIL